jgi:predicted DNA-binding transcriptional regulator
VARSFLRRGVLEHEFIGRGPVGEVEAALPVAEIEQDGTVAVEAAAAHVA